MIQSPAAHCSAYRLPISSHKGVSHYVKCLGISRRMFTKESVTCAKCFWEFQEACSLQEASRSQSQWKMFEDFKKHVHKGGKPRRIQMSRLSRYLTTQMLKVLISHRLNLKLLQVQYSNLKTFAIWTSQSQNLSNFDTLHVRIGKSTPAPASQRLSVGLIQGGSLNSDLWSRLSG